MGSAVNTRMNSRDLSKIIGVSTFGTFIEWYDFFLSGSAAVLVWPFIFFESLGPVFASIVSISTFSIGLVSRPIGSFIFGHYGDKRGRKFTMVIDLLVMGVGSLIIGLVPPETSIGILGGILIIAMRLVQGLGIGGDWGGAATWTMEASEGYNRRGFLSSIFQLAVPFGLITSSTIFTYLLVTMPSSSFLSYGWRIPYFIGFAVAIFGVVARYVTMESPIFNKVVTENKIERLPSVTIFKKYPKKVLILTIAAWFNTATFYFVAVFGVEFLVAFGFKSSFASSTVIYAGIGIIPAIIISGYLSDKVGRKPIVFIGALLGALLVFPAVFMMTFHNLLLGYLSQIILLFFGYGFGYGALSPYISENFPARFRYSGSALAYNIGAPLAGGVVPVVSAVILGIYAENALRAWPYIALVVLAYDLASAIAVLATKETKGEKLTEEV